MAGLLERDTTGAPPAPGPDPQAPEADAAATPAPLACAVCAAPLATAQDWCLECGSARPGRLGGRPGWRAALTVIAACGVLASGAGAAAYAALSSEAQRVASAPAPPAATPTVATPPAVDAPAADAGETPIIKAPETESADVPEIKAPSSDPAPAPAPAPATPVSPADDDDDAAGDDAATTDAAGDDVAIDLPADAASTYDPYDRGNGAVGDPADAVDGKASTAWEAPVGTDGSVRIGLALSLEQAQTVSRLALRADTPGFTVEVYGTRASKLPPDVLDARWENLGGRRDVGVREEIALKGKYRHVLLWVTAQPADTKVAIPEIQLFD